MAAVRWRVDPTSRVLLILAALSPAAGSALTYLFYGYAEMMTLLMAAMSVPALAAAALAAVPARPGPAGLAVRNDRRPLILVAVLAASLSPAGYDLWVCWQALGTGKPAVGALLVAAVFTVPFALYLAATSTIGSTSPGSKTGLLLRRRRPARRSPSPARRRSSSELLLLVCGALAPSAAWGQVLAASAHAGRAQQLTLQLTPQLTPQLTGQLAGPRAGVDYVALGAVLAGTATLLALLAAVVAWWRRTDATWRAAVLVTRVVAVLVGVAVTAQLATLAGSSGVGARYLVSALGMLAVPQLALMGLSGLLDRAARTQPQASPDAVDRDLEALLVRYGTPTAPR